MRSKLFIFFAIAILAQIKTLAADAMSPLWQLMLCLLKCLEIPL